MKPPRLQFSLRMLLLLMAVVGIGLMVYRWPWVEETESFTVLELMAPGSQGPPEREYKLLTRTTYRRDWHGRPVKHGLVQSFRNGQLWYEANYYEDQLHGSRWVRDWRGDVVIEANYRGGLLHGPYRTSGHWKAAGQYQAGKMEGEWRGVISQGLPLFVLQFDAFVDEDNSPQWKQVRLPTPPRRPIEIIANYRQGKRHGKTRWQALDGELLHTAEYVDGDLVTWDGQPVVEQFRDWIETLSDQILKKQLNSFDGTVWESENSTGALRIKSYDEKEGWKVLHIHRERWFDVQPEPKGALIPSLCEFAAEQGLGFDYRYGGLWLVQREGDPSPPFVDQTGAPAVQFEPGSRQQLVWEEPVEVRSLDDPITRQVQGLFQGTGIEIDFGEISFQAGGYRPVGTDYLFTRTRRDVLGLILNRIDCRCEQRGNTVVIQRRWPKSTTRLYESPLSCPAE